MVELNNNVIRDHSVHGWLLDVPGYSDDYINDDILTMEDTHSHKKNRPLSSLSTSSEYSVDLDDLINANFTTDMVDETDLPDLATLELDDSNEDFWKVKQALHQYIPAEQKKEYYYHSNRSTYESNDVTTPNENHFYDTKKNTAYLGSVDASNGNYKNDYHYTPSKLQVPKSGLPLSRRTSASSAMSERERSGSFGSDHSVHSQVTITHGSYQRNLYPSESTSTSSLGSHSSLIPRSFTPSSVTSVDTSSSRISPSSYRQGMSSSLSENSNHSVDTTPSSRLPGRSISGLAKRATHIPAPLSSSNVPSLHRTKSTSLFQPQSTKQTMTRSLSRMGTKRASHIPVPPPRSTTSLGISSVFSTQSSSLLYKNDELQSKLPSVRSSIPTTRSNSRMGQDVKSSLKMPRSISKIGSIKKS